MADRLRPKPAPSRRGTSPESWRAPFERLATGELDALEELYDLASHRLYGLALWRTGDAADAEEVVQEVFVRLASGRAELGVVRDPASWLFAVCHRAAIDLTRRRAVRSAEPLEDCAYLAAPAVDPGREVDAARASTLVFRLPVAQREVVFLRHFAGLTFAAIAEIVGASIFTVASRHRLALARLRRMMSEEGSR